MSLIDTAIIEVLEQHVVPSVNTYYTSSLVSKRPFILGLTGLQGSGKSTWASKLVDTLRERYGYNTITVSLDDFYYDHTCLRAIAAQNSTNMLLQTRGQPGTHDEELAVRFFASLSFSSQNGSGHSEDEILIPVFDKSKFRGEGDRLTKDLWPCIPKSPRVDIVVFEGWCVGFRPLSSFELQMKRKAAERHSTARANSIYPTTTLQDHQLGHLEAVNRNLERYCSSFMGPQHLDYLVHLDTDDLHNVYEWRLQQEHALGAKGQGAMGDDAVRAFVKGYMPAYELYLENLRNRFFTQKKEDQEQEQEADDKMERHKGHVRVVLDRSRRITDVVHIS